MQEGQGGRGGATLCLFDQREPTKVCAYTWRMAHSAAHTQHWTLCIRRALWSFLDWRPCGGNPVRLVEALLRALWRSDPGGDGLLLTVTGAALPN